MSGRPKKGFKQIKRRIEFETTEKKIEFLNEVIIRCPECGSDNVRENGTQNRKNNRIEGFQCANPTCSFRNTHKQGKQFILSTSYQFKKALKQIFQKIILKLGKGRCTHAELSRDLDVSNGLISYIHQKLIRTNERLNLLNQLVAQPLNDTAFAVDETFLKILGKSIYIIIAVGYSSRKVLGLRISETRTAQDLMAVFREAEQNTLEPIRMISADAWGGTQAMVKQLNRPMTLVIHKHKKPYENVVIWEIDYNKSMTKRIITKIGVKSDFFKKRKKREYHYLIEEDSLILPPKKKRGRTKGAKNGQERKKKNQKKRKNVAVKDYSQFSIKENEGMQKLILIGNQCV